MPDHDADDARKDREMSLTGHLSELRARLIKSIAVLIVAIAVSFFVANPVLDVLTKPIRRLEREPSKESVMTIHVRPDGSTKFDKPSDINSLSQKRFNVVFEPDSATTATAQTVTFGERANQGVYFRKPLDPFMVPFRVSLVVGILLALPFVLYQLWLFIMPGLKPAEKRLVRAMLGAAIFLFPVGALFGFVMVDMLMRTMQAYQPPSLEPLFDIDEYLSLLTNMMIVFGVVFELPLFVALAARVGLVTPNMLTTYRRQAYLLLAVAAVIITPADVISMVAALIPLALLYEVSIWAARPMARMHRGDSDEAEAEA